MIDELDADILALASKDEVSAQLGNATRADRKPGAGRFLYVAHYAPVSCAFSRPRTLRGSSVSGQRTACRLPHSNRILSSDRDSPHVVHHVPDSPTRISWPYVRSASRDGRGFRGTFETLPARPSAKTSEKCHGASPCAAAPECRNFRRKPQTFRGFHRARNSPSPAHSSSDSSSSTSAPYGGSTDEWRTPTHRRRACVAARRARVRQSRRVR